MVLENHTNMAYCCFGYFNLKIKSKQPLHLSYINPKYNLIPHYHLVCLSEKYQINATR